MKAASVFVALSLSGLLSATAQAQLVPDNTLQPALQPILPPRVLQRTAEQAQQQLQQQQLQQQQLQQQLTQLARLPDPLTVLTPVLEVLDKHGQVRWREVEVEQGFRAVEREWLLLLSASQWQQLAARWPQLASYVQSNTELQALALLLVQLKVPVELDSASALQQQFNAELAALAGRNHLYQPQAEAGTSVAKTSGTVAAMCTVPVRMGMIDTAILATHPALAEAGNHFSLQQRHFLPDDIAPVYSHGTAVAGVLAAEHAQISPLLPQLALYNAGAFYASSPFQQSATLAHLLQALNWLASQQLTVINMSLTGPDNPVLAQAISTLAEQQRVLVAAAGNAGPAGAPLYPAAYPQVIAVTAVDEQQLPYRWANQGDYIDYAALGVRIPALTVNGDVSMQSGTSLATPVVSAAVACLQARQPGISLAQIRQHLTQQARDLGEPGKDSVFGYGLIRPPLKTQLHSN